jgi:hypothetical protein
MDEPSLFAGRSQQIELVARGLHTDRACPIVFGDRGLGKSSIALQAQRIATGDVELLGRLGLERWGFDEDTCYVATYLQCTDAVQNTRNLFQRAINSLRLALDPTHQPVAKELIDSVTRVKINAKLLELESEKRYEPRARRIEPSFDYEERLSEAVELVVQLTGRRVLFIIDEIDRVRDTKGLASFIKSNSSADLRFILVGIAQNISSLLADHQSLERMTLPVKVPRMSRKELEVIVDRAEAWLADRQIHLAFEPAAKKMLAELAGGYPWFVHVLGQQALVNADEDGELLVGKEHVQRAITTLTENRFAQQFSDIYQMAVRNSKPREIVLRTFAKWEDGDIPTGEIYAALRGYMGVNNPSTYKGHLCTDQYGRILVTPAYQDRGLVRFHNEMFKVYVRMRDSIFVDTKEVVDAGWKEFDS